MTELARCKCGSVPSISSKGKGFRVRCDSCGREYSHPEYSECQLAAVWNYAVTSANERDEEE